MIIYDEKSGEKSGEIDLISTYLSFKVHDEVLDKTVLHKGIHGRCNIGFLTHAEFVNPKVHTVGSCYKTPRFPIWVANNNTTLCVLFSLKRGLLSDWKLERRCHFNVLFTLFRGEQGGWIDKEADCVKYHNGTNLLELHYIPLKWKTTDKGLVPCVFSKLTTLL